MVIFNEHFFFYFFTYPKLDKLLGGKIVN